MKLSRERKIYVSLLAVGIVALVVDRLSGGPQSVGAADASEYALPAPAPSEAQKPATYVVTATVTTQPSLSAKLKRVAGPTTRDLFRAPASWVRALPVTPATVPAGKELTPVDFERTHRLTAVLLKGKDAHAVVDGKMIAPGQAIDGFVLITVTQDAAVFRSSSGTAILRSEQKVPINGIPANPLHP